MSLPRLSILMRAWLCVWALGASAAALAGPPCRTPFDSLDSGDADPEVKIQVAADESVPVFGDIHGNIVGLLQSIQRLQVLNRKTYKYVLQVGDFGYFPDENHRELSGGGKRRWDPELERGVSRYLRDPKVYRQFYEKPDGFRKLEAKIIFIRGNHEDHEALADLAGRSPGGLVPIDPYGTLFYLPDGEIQSLGIAPGIDLIVAAAGGIDPDTRSSAVKRNPEQAFNERAIDSLIERSDVGIDVLITHQGGWYTTGGSANIDTLCELAKPKLHLHGHSHAYYPLREAPGAPGTMTAGLSRIPDTRNPPITGSNLGFIECGADGFVAFRHVIDGE